MQDGGIDEVNDEDRKKLDTIIELLQGLTLENKGIRTHISTAQDLNEGVLKDVTRMVREIRNRQ
jgi:phage terminase large subunit-like protein